jgi:allophanate hydrolase subunit 1
MSGDAPRISLLRTSALLFEAPGETCLPTQQRIWALAAEAGTWPEVREAVPGMNNLMLGFTRAPADPGVLAARLR